MQKIFLFLIALFLCILPFDVRANKISEEQALNRLLVKIEKAGLYKSRIKFECLNFTNEKETGEYFDFRVGENHRGKKCSGDLSAAPTVDRFRVFKKTKNILWYQAIEGKFVNFAQAPFRR